MDIQKWYSCSNIQKPIALQGHVRSLTKVIFNPEGDLVFSSSKDLSANVWFFHNGERLGTFDGHEGTIWTLDVSRDSRKLISGSADNTARVWDVNTGRTISTIKTLTSVRALNIAMGGKQLVLTTDAIMGHPAKIQTYSLEDNSLLHEIVIKGPKPTVIKYSDCNKFLLSGHEDGTMCRWNVDSGELLDTVKIHDKSITDMQFSKDKTYFISSSKDTTAKLIDSSNFEIIKTYKTDRPLNSASISPIRNEVIVGGGQEATDVTTTSTKSGKFEVQFFDSIFEEEIGRVKGHFGPLNTVAYHPEGIGFASGAEDGFVRIHEFDPDYFDFEFKQ